MQPYQPEQPEQPEQPTVVYAVTNNQKGNKTNNLRDAQSTNANLIQTYQNDELVIVNSVSDDGLWYDVTVVRDGNRGYMRDYLLTQISEADALKRIDEINAGQTTPPSEETQTPAGEETQTPTGEETQTPTGEETPKPAPEQMTFPAYGITVDTAATILLRDTPDGAIPQTGALKQINNPTPVRISGQETGANDQIWYLVENLTNGDAGYTEAYNVRVVSEQEAMDAVKTPEPTIAPIETPTPEPTEEPTISVPEEFASKMIDMVTRRKGEMVSMETQGDRVNIEFDMPSRGIIGLRTNVLTASQGEAIMAHRFKEYQPYKGEIPRRTNGSMIAMESGAAIASAIDKLQGRG